jgi:hypothetical protein
MMSSLATDAVVFLDLLAGRGSEARNHVDTASVTLKSATMWKV